MSPCPLRGATSWGTAKCHHILLQQCHIQGYVLWRCQVPPLSRSATSWGTVRCHHVPSEVQHPGALPGATMSSSMVMSLGTAKCHHSPQVPHPGSLPSATTSCPNSATSVVTSLGTPGATTPLLQKCHTQFWLLRHCQVPPRPSLALSHPGSHPWTLPGATVSSPGIWGVSGASGAPHVPGRTCWNRLWHTEQGTGDPTVAPGGPTVAPGGPGAASRPLGLLKLLPGLCRCPGQELAAGSGPGGVS